MFLFKKIKEQLKSNVIEPPTHKFQAIPDNFESIEAVQKALEKAGLESSQLIIGVDFTKSNTWSGKRTFHGKCLHTVHKSELNPYQRAIDVIARTLAPFDQDNLIPCYGFGDQITTDQAVFSFFEKEKPAQGLEEVLSQYVSIVPHVVLSGPTSFAPVINKAIQIVEESGRQYHILLIIADGQVTSKKETRDAIIRASYYPLSIVCVGVGDGPWDELRLLDDELPERVFDNFQFVDFEKVCGKHSENPDVAFALAACMELPDQYAIIRKLDLMQNN